jgi:hypothetical protein
VAGKGSYPYLLRSFCRFDQLQFNIYSQLDGHLPRKLERACHLMCEMFPKRSEQFRSIILRPEFAVVRSKIT